MDQDRAEPPQTAPQSETRIRDAADDENAEAGRTSSSDAPEAAPLTETARRVLLALEARAAFDLIDLASSAHVTPREAREAVNTLQAEGLMRDPFGSPGDLSLRHGHIALDRDALQERLDSLAKSGS